MMEGQPIKFRILELFEEKGPMWTDEIVPILQDEYHMKGDYGRDMANFDLIELVSAGLLRRMATTRRTTLSPTMRSPDSASPTWMTLR